MASYTLNGTAWTTSEGRDRLAALRRRYLEAGARHRERFVLAYPSLHTSDAVFAGFPETLGRALDEATAMAAADIAGHRIYTINESRLRAELEQRAAQVSERFEAAYDQYLAIIGASADAREQRVAARGQRARLVGGGFGVEGAARGIAVAGAANAAVGLLHGIAGAAEGALGAMGDKRKKHILFDAAETRDALGDYLCRVILQGHELVADLVNDSAGERVFDLIDDRARVQADALVQNVAAGRVPDDDQANALRQALDLDPFAPAVWVEWLSHFGDAGGSVEAVANSFCVELAPLKQQKLREKRMALQWATPEQCQASGVELEHVAVGLGLPFAEERARISAQTEALDRQRRTFDGDVYDTIEAMHAARERSQELERLTVDGFTYATLHEADAARTEASDKVTRTVDGTVFPTRAEADKARSLVLRRQYLPLWLAIILGPWPTALFTLKAGFTRQQRIIALGWMTFMLIAVALPSSPSEVVGALVRLTVWGVVVGGIAITSWRTDEARRAAVATEPHAA